MDMFDFSEDEIQEQLEILGYTNIPKHRLRHFKQDLDELIRNGDWAPASPALRNTATAQHSPPAFTKEKVSWSQLKESGEGFFLHAAKADGDRGVSTTGQSGLCDSYAKHSVTQKPRLPPSAPGCLRVESDLEDTLTPSLGDSYSSSPDTQGRRFIRRKVLRKREGQSLVCDESVYSEDSVASRRRCSAGRSSSWMSHNPLSSSLSPVRSHTPAGGRIATMYNMYDEESDDGGSSFWSDEESRPVTAAEDPLQKASEEDELELMNREDSHGPRLEDEAGFSSGSHSPAPSVVTSGYGTYRPEEHEGGFREDHSMTELDQDSGGDPSGARDMEDDEPKAGGVGGGGQWPEDDGAGGGGDGQWPEAGGAGGGGQRPEAGDDSQWPEAGGAGGGGVSQQHRDANLEQGEASEGERLASVARDEWTALNVDPGETEQVEKQEEEDESSSNKDVRFIDSTVDLSWMYASSCLQERLAALDVAGDSDEDASLTAFQSYLRGTVGRTRSAGDLRPKPKSFIRPVTSQQSVKKTDPVAKYLQYKQLWELFKQPGEKDRRALRWEIREQLAHRPPPPKPRRVYLPNTYVVPTEKKRSALRWEVRTDLARGLLPHTFSHTS